MKKIKQIIPQVKAQKYHPIISKLNGNSEDIIKRLKEIAGQEYQWTKEIIKVHDLLANYFYGRKKELDLDKGIALIGKYGTGKTTIFNIWHEYLRIYHPFCDNLFINTSLEEILDDISQQGYITRKYVYNLDVLHDKTLLNPRHLLINEFGYKYNIKTYGTDINELFESFMMKRYDIFQQRKKLTHITTNFGTNDLKEIFHPKLVDRFKEMFNIIELKGESFRR